MAAKTQPPATDAKSEGQASAGGAKSGAASSEAGAAEAPSGAAAKTSESTSAETGKGRAKTDTSEAGEPSAKSAAQSEVEQPEPEVEQPEPEVEQPEPEVASQSDVAQPSAEAEPTYAELIAPQALPDLEPTAPHPAPGLAPPGDSRSMRRRADNGQEFCLLYRVHRSLVLRQGLVGQYGEVVVTEYPSEASAAHAYAHACSKLTADGFFDLRG